MIKYIAFFSVAITLSLIFTPAIRIAAVKLKILDYPSERKIHKQPTPMLGGIPIFLAFNLTILFGILFKHEILEDFLLTRWKPIFAAQIIILSLGIFDDVKKVSPKIKFVIQLFSGSLLVFFGFHISLVTNPFTGNTVDIGLFSIPLTILWVVGITNALNLIDGLDGLAAGTSFIACVTIFGISFIYQNIGVALVALILAGSILGFLRYNFNPAKIFLGDSGSLLLGFLLAVLSLQGVHKGATMVAVLAPVLALGFPIIDTLLTIVRRVLRPAIPPEQSQKSGKLKEATTKFLRMFAADQDHIHHRLLKFGYSQRKVVIILYGICFVLCALALLTVAWKNLNIALFVTAIILASFIGIKGLKYQELRFFEKGTLLPLFKLPLINKRFFQSIIDLFFIAFSYYVSFYLVFDGFRGTPAKNLFIQIIPYMLVLKIIVFYFSGLYRGTWRYSSIEDFIKIGNAVLFSSAISFLLLTLIVGITPFGGPIFFLLDFYFLLTLVAGIRISYRVADHYYQKQYEKTGKKIIIYGAGRKGALIAKEIQYDRSLDYNLIGYIDDDIQKIGKSLLDKPILGSIDDIENIMKKNKISEIILSTQVKDTEKLNLIKKLCEENNVNLIAFKLQFEKIE